MDELSVKCLLYADDEVIIAPTVCDLQAMCSWVNEIDSNNYRTLSGCGSRRDIRVNEYSALLIRRTDWAVYRPKPFQFRLATLA
ncbi:hypothetical protein EVAR_16322_1 [Eumeta japonica]|uniref:Reverse transcriptase domain-containing protein n=1 Tax=Eumeta variegata TaxID=151549 RepID=A0A4C1VGI1_EUMVA|nr:hypothetical protein EVAR_16322_1 [Eumeta japonica]